MISADKTIRVGCASAFWGDTGSAANQLVTKGQLDYLVFDYLAELTMSIMAGAKLKNPEAGFAPDFISTLKPLLPSISKQGIKVCSNAGGINPHGCAQALQKVIDELGVNLTIAVVEGDNLTDQQAEFQEQSIKEMFTDKQMPSQLLSVNAYLGAPSIAQAFGAGADIVITGRVVDSAVIVGPLVHEFNWQWTDYDLLAQASLAGHVIECGTQCTGGNFTDWHLVKDGYANMGFPIVECHSDGSFVVTKIKDTGGLVSCDTVAEQVLYEIGDPSAYLLPDVICDFTQVTLTQQAKDRVLVVGAKGRAPSSQYKVSATYLDGFRSTATFMIGGREAVAKGQVVAEAIIERVRGIFHTKAVSDFSNVNIEILGGESTYGENSVAQATREVVVKIAVQHADRRALNLFSLEIAQAATAMVPGITGLVGGRPKPTPRICLFSFLLNKESLNVSYRLLKSGAEGSNSAIVAQIDTASANDDKNHKISWHTNEMAEVLTDENTLTVPLIDLALARSGDKGNHCNIGVKARHENYLPYIEAALSKENIAKYFNHLLADNSIVHIYQLPALNAINILIENSLGGGGMASLRIDPQGKAIAQQLLDMPISISKNIYNGEH